MLPLDVGVTVVLPARDEAANLRGVVARVVGSLEGRLRAYEIVVVDDGSGDDTAAVATELAEAGAPLRLVRHRRGRGYGAALASGFEAARYDWVFLTDADGQFALEELASAVEEAAHGRAVLGYRHPRADRAVRRWLGTAWTSLARSALRLRVRDVNCAFKLVPRHVVVGPSLRCRGAAVSAEIVGRLSAADVEYVEVPVAHRPRSAGRPKGASLRVAAGALAELLALVFEGFPTATDRPAARRGDVGVGFDVHGADPGE